jgi:serine protease AprX
VITTTCHLCGGAADRRVLTAAPLTPVLLPLAQAERPGWRTTDGACPACALRLTARFAATRSATPLHTTVEPNTTFPYYHADEEAVLSQAKRLTDYPAFTGAGVTIAFLDSGYYPHPDLLAPGAWAGDELPHWPRLSQTELRALISQKPLRLVDYVDLTDFGEQRGLETPSLWDGAGDSWHGQMTTAIAAGNGLLSHGRYRGLAPQAGILPIKIGRGGGRIPEEDILAGLNWLLTDDRWQEYGVRVINISVGGDFPQEWQENPICRAAHALAQRGVFIAAAAGNRGVEELLAPAQTPTVFTVGGVDDQNRRWRPDHPADVARLALYPHNYGGVHWAGRLIRKPEVLALGRWLPSPVLPNSRVFRETYAIAEVRQVLRRQAAELGAVDVDDPANPPPWLPDAWAGLRRHMNAHKLIHPCYQHVDGTSVAVAQVSAVAAQMIQANPALLPEDVRHLLADTALPLRHLPTPQRGAGLLQPARAVAAALRSHGGRLTGYPVSGALLPEHELHKWESRGTVRIQTLAAPGEPAFAVYLGCLAPDATQVSVVGAFNNWQPGATPLQPATAGWWHTICRLPHGAHAYRFWIEDVAHAGGGWQRDGENPATVESGLATPGGWTDSHSVIEG